MWYDKIVKEIQNNPRICDVCGCTETVTNVIIKYDDGRALCDDCLIACTPMEWEDLE